MSIAPINLILDYLVNLDLLGESYLINNLQDDDKTLLKNHIISIDNKTRGFFKPTELELVPTEVINEETSKSFFDALGFIINEHRKFIKRFYIFVEGKRIKISDNKILSDLDSSFRNIQDNIKELLERRGVNENTTGDKIESDEILISKDFSLIKLEANALSEKLSEIDSTYSNNHIELERKLAQYKSSIEKLEKSSKSKTVEIEEEFNKAILKNSLALEEEISEMRLLNERSIKSFSEKSLEVDKLIGTISDKALSGNYSIYAEEEKNEADKMRLFSLGFMMISIILALVSFGESLIQDISNSTFISRVIFAIVLSIPAAYFARESSKHRNQQQLYRKTDLDLKAVGPYSATLPDQDQHELKKDIASKIFAKDTTSKSEKSYPIDIQELMLELLKNAKNEAKSKPKVRSKTSEEID